MDYSTGELLLGLRYLRNRQDGSVQGLISELLPGLPYLRNQLFGFGGEKAVNYCLIYGTSETTPASRVRTSSVSYYLVYGASETERQRVAHRRMVNYYLDYRTSETNKAPSAGSTSVNYCLIYGTSETNGEVRTILQVVNYCLIYRTSETPRLKVKKRKKGELLPGLPYIRNGSTPGKAWAPGELLLGLRYL